MSSAMRRVAIDGSMLEGGGQILRNASALSAITGQVVEVSKIRAARAKPGLAAQHLTGLTLVNTLSNGRMQGGELRSCQVEMAPGQLACGAYLADVQTAGSLTLLVQSALPCALFACHTRHSRAAAASPTTTTSCAAVAAPSTTTAATASSPQTTGRGPGPGGVVLPAPAAATGSGEAGVQDGKRGRISSSGSGSGTSPAKDQQAHKQQQGQQGRGQQHGLGRGQQHGLGQVQQGRGQQQQGQQGKGQQQGHGQARQGPPKKVKPSGPQVALMDPPPDLPPDVTLLHLCGGTNADMAPPVDYMMHVLLPTLRARLGVEVEAELVRRGFYPRGGGVLKVRVHALQPGATLPAIDLTNRGQVASIHVHAFTAGRVPAHVGTRMADSATAALRAAVREGGAGMVAEGVVIDSTVVRETDSTAMGDGGGVLVTATTTTGCILGASALAQKGVTAEEVAEQVVKEISTALGSGACVDTWLEDQLIIFMALASGRSRMLCGELTLHTRTAMVVAEALTACKFKVHEREGGLWLVECQGAGHIAPC